MAQGTPDFDTGHPDYDLVIAATPLLGGAIALRLGCCDGAACSMRLTERSVLSVQLKDIGSGNFGVAKLMRYKPTGELVAVKFIERGDKVWPLPVLPCTPPSGPLHRGPRDGCVAAGVINGVNTAWSL